MCFYDDGIYPEFQDDRVVTAKKEHKCSECKRAIAKGEQYYRHSGKCDGSFYVVKQCRRCCYDYNRIVESELAEGCHWSESFPPLGELKYILGDYEMTWTKPEDVPVWFQVGDQPRIPAKEVAT